MSKWIDWIVAHRTKLGVGLEIVAGVVHILAPGTKADLVVAFLGSHLIAAGLFKSDQYHKDRQEELKK